MKATESKLFKFLQKSAQFIIPIYQRQYSWTQEQCEQLWKDIVRAGTTDLEAHFIGSVVYVERGLYSHSDVPQLLVIDGQQRLTSTTLLIAALVSELNARSADNTSVIEGTNAKKLKKYYLCNDAEDGDLYYKLLLTKADDKELRAIIDNEAKHDDDATSRVIQNYQFFKDKLSRLGNEKVSEIYLGLQKLLIVDIALDRERDNPQLIFESLNSTGLDLSQADLIRNFVLMGLEPKQQNTLYERYWFPMESDFGNGEYSWLFNQFMRDYLTLKTNKPPRINDVYEAFKKYVSSSHLDIEDVVADVRKHAQFYIAFSLEQEKEQKLLEAFQDLNAYKVDVSYPLILELYHDYDSQILTLDEFIECVRLIESYVFRRYVCDIPTNSLNKTFASFARSIRKSSYLESFKAELISLSSYRRFPSDSELNRCLQHKDMYNVRSRAYWLRRLENYDKKERISVENYTIEHVLPQNKNLSSQWQIALGDDWQSIQEEYVHTIGNLTLTGYNSELSDRFFTEKRDMEGGFASSPLTLNQSLRDHDTWNKESIQARSKLLADKMQTVWRYPNLSAEILEKYQTQPSEKTAYTIADHPYIAVGSSKELFQVFSQKVMSLDENVKQEFLKLYVAFKLDTNFVDVVPQASGLRLSLNCKFTEIHDPKKLCRDVTNLGRWGNGDVEYKITDLSDIPYAIQLIQQVIDIQVEG
ncbi:GmrSD restriction endonuclease domain-containing protein [Vibrio diabolicus]|uniref:GmrSD restriction endonuclease domain-containing protein n=1 Tax=Vibrio diabolicus TaxID=50719 RepID=UPI003753288B